MLLVKWYLHMGLVLLELGFISKGMLELLVEGLDRELCQRIKIALVFIINSKSRPQPAPT